MIADCNGCMASMHQAQVKSYILLDCNWRGADTRLTRRSDDVFRPGNLGLQLIARQHLDFRLQSE